MCEVKTEDYLMDKILPEDCNSTKVLGMLTPDPTSSIMIENGLEVPKGKLIKTGLKTLFVESDYVIYKLCQAKLRYLVQVQWRF